MSFWNKVRGRKFSKKLRSKVGLTASNKFWRQAKRLFSPALANPTPYSASSYPTYQYQGRTLSQLTGGV